MEALAQAKHERKIINQPKVYDWSNPTVASSCSPRIQEFIILPTEQCNFRCTYCYEDFKVGAMSDEVQASIEKLLDRRIPELESLTLSWFGGEPLAARKAVLRIAAHAKKLCDLYGVNLSGALTTNAWLLDFELFEDLLRLDQRFFQITLDGWRSEHDKFRKRANGGGTFDRIWDNLLAFRSSSEPFEVQLRIHVRRESWRELDELILAIAEHFGRDLRFTLDFEHIRNLGGDGGKSVKNPLSLEELRTIEVDLKSMFEAAMRKYHPDLIRQRGQSEQNVERLDSSTDGARADAKNYDGYVCYAAKPNSLLIRADGRIGKCTVALTDNRNTIGSIAADGSLKLDNRKLQPWIRGMQSLNPMELGCPLVGLNAATDL